MTETITVVKNDHAGREILRYTGHVLAREALVWVQLEARFSRPDVVTPYHTFRQGDRFVEWYYSDRWYNIFEMHDRDDDRLTGWYCNVTRPAVIAPDIIRADDLALDVFAAPDGSIRVLDEDEFAALPLDESTRAHAIHALETLKYLVLTRQPPFVFPGSA
jgi:predicted RNA-binding protein associated with RNAse of E/G family